MEHIQRERFLKQFVKTDVESEMLGPSASDNKRTYDFYRRGS